MQRAINREQKRGFSTSFGVTIKERTFAEQNTRYQFNGKEYDSETETSDFGARNLDGDLGVWGTPDAVMQPSKSPYSYVDNNPIIYVDRNGEDNVIYLVALPSSKTNFTKEDVQSIANKANKIYEDMGLNTRVVVFESNEPFSPKHLDPSDSYALIGSVSDIRNYVDGDNFSKEIKEKANELSSEADLSVNGGKGILISIEGNSDFAKGTGETEVNTAAFLIAHGGGHNIGFNHTSADGDNSQKLRKEGEDMLGSTNSRVMSTGEKVMSSLSGVGGTVTPIDGANSMTDFTKKDKNSSFITKMKNSFFGNNKSQDKYGFNKMNSERAAKGQRPVKKEER